MIVLPWPQAKIPDYATGHHAQNSNITNSHKKPTKPQPIEKKKKKKPLPQPQQPPLSTTHHKIH